MFKSNEESISKKERCTEMGTHLESGIIPRINPEMRKGTYNIDYLPDIQGSKTQIIYLTN